VTWKAGRSDAAAAGIATVTDIGFVEIGWRGRRVRIEHAWIARERRKAPLMVFLHEGLGSLAMWRDFPQRLCDAIGARGLVYSRPGYGRSTPRAAQEAWGLDFMHRQAHEVLPELLAVLGVDARREPPWLFGHSDGGSIALLYAARLPGQVAGAIVLAPHIRVEDLSVASIEKARDAYLQTDLPQRLARYHDDPDSAFWGWNRIWLHPPFRQWSIEAEIGSIGCPLLAVQGLDDEYGTLEQIRGIARRVPHTELLELADCGHSPHRDQPDWLIGAVVAFVRTQGDRADDTR
jgi:pimeloyl-ACP methyl ester carboxylesterase